MYQPKRVPRLTLASCALLLLTAAAQAAPLAFEPNLGQTGSEAAYLARTSGGTLFLTPGEIVLRIAEPLPAAQEGPTAATGKGLLAAAPSPAKPRQHVLRIQPVGARAARLESSQPLESRSSYYRAGGGTLADVPHFARVTYRGIYPGTDLVLRGEDGRWAYDFVLAPQADPRDIALRFEGAGAPRLEADGSLSLDTPLGPVHQTAPFLYQQIGGEKVQVAGGFELRRDGLVGFTVGAYDRGRELVIDPTVIFKTCIGGVTGLSEANGIEVTPNGQTYIVGKTYATDFPHPGGTGDGNFSDAFVAKLDLAGNLHRATYFDFGGEETGESIDLYDSNNVIISGASHLDSSGHQAFVAKLSPLLDLVNWSRTFGGSDYESAQDVVFDPAGNVFVTGLTYSTNFCTSGFLAGSCTLKTTLGGTSDAFLIKLGRNGGLMWSTLAGNHLFDRATALAVDPSGRPYLAGFSDTPGAPTVFSAWVRRFAADGSALGYHFQFGKLPNLDEDENPIWTFTAPWDLAVDPQNNAYLVGYTNSTRLEVPGAVQATFGGYTDAFVGMVNNSGSAFVYNTYFGGAGYESGDGIRVYNGHAYIGGTREGAGGFNDGFVARYWSGGLSQVFFQKFGGGLSDHVYALAQDSSRNVYAAGWTQSNDFDGADPACTSIVPTVAKAMVVKVAP